MNMSNDPRKWILEPLVGKNHIQNWIMFLLAVHHLNLNVAIEAFDAHGLRGQNDKLLDVPDMITVLASLYETISASHPTTVNVPLCLDLTLNWMLNVYDW
jgi:hypothetical protein